MIRTFAFVASGATTDLFALVNTDRARLLAQDGVTVAALQLFERLPQRPLVTVSWAMQALSASRPTITRAIQLLERAGILVPLHDKKRDHVWAWQAYLERLRAGTELGLDA